MAGVNNIDDKATRRAIQRIAGRLMLKSPVSSVERMTSWGFSERSKKFYFLEENIMRIIGLPIDRSLLAGQLPIDQIELFSDIPIHCAMRFIFLGYITI